MGHSSCALCPGVVGRQPGVTARAGAMPLGAVVMVTNLCNVLCHGGSGQRGLKDKEQLVIQLMAAGTAAQGLVSSTARWTPR